MVPRDETSPGGGGTDTGTEMLGKRRWQQQCGRWSDGN